MPLYEYECEKCKKRWETLVDSSAAPAPACPSCGGKAQKLFSRVSTVTHGESACGSCCGKDETCHPGGCGCSGCR
jgi:putative FmdB family regulatory protein